MVTGEGESVHVYVFQCVRKVLVGAFSFSFLALIRSSSYYTVFIFNDNVTTWFDHHVHSCDWSLLMCNMYFLKTIIEFILSHLSLCCLRVYTYYCGYINVIIIFWCENTITTILKIFDNSCPLKHTP